MYILGQKIVPGDYPKQGGRSFEESLQSSVDKFVNAGKLVYIVSTPPEPLINIRDYLPIQPLRPEKKEYILHKNDVLSRQKEYLDILGRIHGATVISQS